MSSCHCWCKLFLFNSRTGKEVQVRMGSKLKSVQSRSELQGWWFSKRRVLIQGEVLYLGGKISASMKQA